MKRNLLLNIFLFNILIFIIIYLKIWWLLPLNLFYLFLIAYFYNWKIILIIIITCFSSLAWNTNIFQNKINKQTIHIGKVYQVYSNSILIKEKGQKYFLINIHDILSPGDKIKFYCKYKTINQKGYFDIFIKSTKSLGIGYPKNLKLIKKNNNFRNNIHNNLLKHKSKYCSYTLAMLYKTTTDDNLHILSNIKKMGLSFLFVISGFHISLIYRFFEKFTKGKLKLIPIIFILLFLYLTYFPPTGIRAFLTIFLLRFQKISKMDCLSFVAILFFIINPWILLCNSMILSFGITGFIYSFFTYSKKNKLSQMLILNFSCFLISIPTLLTWNQGFNLTTPLLAFFVTPIISLSYFISILFILFPKSWFIINFYFIILDTIINFLSNIILKIEVGSINIYKQIYLTIITGLYIFKFRKNNIILLNTFLIIDILFIIIKLSCFI